MRIRLIVAGCFLFLTIGLAQADNTLRGLTKIHLRIEAPDRETLECGIAADTIRDAFLYPMSTSKLNISNDRSTPEFYVQVTTIKANAGCISNINYAVQEFLLINPTYAEQQVGIALYWFENSLITSASPSGHQERARRTVEEAAKRFLTKWNLDNEP